MFNYCISLIQSIQPKYARPTSWNGEGLSECKARV